MTSPPETIIVVGAGQAGGWAAKTLRDEGFAGRIVLVAEEEHPPHERPPLSKAVLSGAATPESTHIFKPEVLSGLNLDLRRPERVTAIDRLGKSVTLANGESLHYDRLILCTGGQARKLAVPGTDLPGVFTLRTIADALAIGSALQGEGKRLVVIGGGWIGLEVAATARKRGAQVTVVEAMGRLCERTVPEGLSAHLLALHDRNGVEIVLNGRLEELVRRSAGDLVVRLGDGREIHADVAVLGVGLVANDAVARAAGIECDNGILVDEQCRTSDGDIFAAGDVAVAPNRWTGRRMRLESWQNAQDQGIAAAKSALGHDVRYDPLPWFWSDQFDLNLQIFGLPAPTHRVVVRGDLASSSFLVLYLEGDQIKAAVGANAGRDLRFAKRLIEQGKRVQDEALADPAVPLAKM